MDLTEIKARYPDIDPEELYPLFPQMPMSEYPELAGYTREQIYDNALAPGGLFLASDMAAKMGLSQGMRVLDLGPGHGASSRFLAKHYGAHVVAGELWISPTKHWSRIQEDGLENLVMPMRLDGRKLPFAEGYFDAVFSMDAFAYFMTDDLYPQYLAKFLAPGGVVCIGGHCYATELTPDTPKEFLWEISRAYHSPPWWSRHFQASGQFEIVHCEQHPRGREIWLDQVRRELEECHPRDMNELGRENNLQSIVMLLTDTERFITQFILVARRT